MVFGSIIVIILRLIVPISILRYPLGGLVASMAIDFFEPTLIDILGRQGGILGAGLVDYHLLDKWLDSYYLFFALLVAFKWQNVLFRKIAVSLFLFRFLGVLLFSLTSFREVLFFFPNLFEVFFLYYLIVKHWFSQFIIRSLPKFFIIFVILSGLKLVQEYLIHVKQLTFRETINLLTPFQIEAPTVWEWFKSLF